MGPMMSRGTRIVVGFPEGYQTTDIMTPSHQQPSHLYLLDKMTSLQPLDVELSERLQSLGIMGDQFRTL